MERRRESDFGTAVAFTDPSIPGEHEHGLPDPLCVRDGRFGAVSQVHRGHIFCTHIVC